MAPDMARSTPRAVSRFIAGLAFLVLTSGGCAWCEVAPVEGYDEDIDAELEAQLARVGLGPGDVFEVAVWNEPTMSGVYRVGPDGFIHFPLIGDVAVDSLTPNEIATAIRERLMDGYLRNPNVSVFVREFNSKKIYVLGEVVRPGTFPFVANMTIVEALTSAGGFTQSANTNNVIVTRREAGREARVRLPVEKITRGEAPNYGLRPGDIIFVPDRLL
jgi:protein involved in polysaccharide export with SLBB domain